MSQNHPKSPLAPPSGSHQPSPPSAYPPPPTAGFGVTKGPGDTVVGALSPFASESGVVPSSPSPVVADALHHAPSSHSGIRSNPSSQTPGASAPPVPRRDFTKTTIPEPALVQRTDVAGAAQARPLPRTIVADQAPRLPASTPLGAGPGGTVVAGDSDYDYSEGLGSSSGVVPHRTSQLKEIPKEIGQYELIRELGRGGMGVVYLARDSRLGRRVAVKLLQTDSPELTSRFIVEAQATARCDHENIVVIYEVGEHQGSPFMVLEYLQGQTVAELLEKSGLMQWTRVVDIMVSVMRALVRAHSQGIVHRDLKPENIFITDSGIVKVLDFGIAKVLREEATSLGSTTSTMKAINAKSTGVAGTLAYMSPEQWEMAGLVDHRSDIWAVGVILYELLAGQHPLLHDLDNFQRRVTDPNIPMPSLRKANSDITPELAQVVDRCLEKSPLKRYKDAEELLKALEPFLPGRFRAWGNFDRGPYTGLRAFQEEDAACFFGRNAEISAMVGRVFDQPMLAVVGPSGIGKSSLIRAGVVPALRSFGANWRILVLRPGPQPLMSLATMLQELKADLAEVGEFLQEPTNLGIRLKMEPGYLGQLLRKVADQTNVKCMLFVDQFEELYTLCDTQEQRQAFTQCLTGAADDASAPIRLMISVRADFLGRISEDTAFMAEISRGLFFLGAPGPAALREALVQPAEMVGYRFETQQMVSEMVDHLQSASGALPLLQFTAFQLWEKRDAGRKLLTSKSYDALGGIAGALATHADQVVQKMSVDARNMCRALFLQLVTPERTRAIREVDELYELVSDRHMLKQVLHELVESRLLVLNTGGGGGGATVEIIHESLIEAWRTLRRWLEESHEDSMFLEQLRAAARQWSTKKKDSGLLWSGEMAEELFRFRRRYKGELSDIVSAFADAVHNHLQRRARLKKLFAVLGVGFLLAMLAAAGVALVVISQAQREAEKNEENARRAEAQAQQRLLDLQEKERARQMEAEKRALAETEVEKANTTIDETKDELALRNADLEEALERAEAQRVLATDAQQSAERNERQAREAEERAKFLLKREQERADRLNKQLGSPLVEVLK